MERASGFPVARLSFLPFSSCHYKTTYWHQRENYIVKCCPGWCQHPILNGCHQVGIPSGNRVQVSETTRNRVWIVALTARWGCGVLQHPFPSHSTTHKGCCWKCQDIYMAPTKRSWQKCCWRSCCFIWGSYLNISHDQKLECKTAIIFPFFSYNITNEIFGLT